MRKRILRGEGGKCTCAPAPLHVCVPLLSDATSILTFLLTFHKYNFVCCFVVKVRFVRFDIRVVFVTFAMVAGVHVTAELSLKKSYFFLD